MLLVVALVAGGCTDDAPSGKASDSSTSIAPSALSLDVATGHPDMVSGGDALVLVTGDASGATFDLDGTDVSDAFAEQADGRLAGSTVALVEGLDEGDNVLTARRDGEAVARLTITNHPLTGPIFSGPHQTPFICTTEQMGLGPATDADCSAPTTTSWIYFTDDPEADPLPLDDPTDVPDDVAMVERDGEEVPLIVRVEKGVINRSIYEIAVLEPEPDPSAPPRSWDDSGWNGRLVYEYGGGCGTGYQQGAFLGHAINRDLMAAGYANVTSTLNVFQTACNDVLSAETTLMVKEHFIETYGYPVHTIGVGGSGGSIQVHLITQNYPGLLDAIQPSLPFPDAVTIAAGVTDCGLLASYWGTPGGSTFTDEQRLAVQGHGSLMFCQMWGRTFLDAVNPQKGCNALVTPDLAYDPATSRDGARCTLQDSNANLYPHDPETGFAERPLDNVGVQYGLEALRAGTIDVDQFLDLNEHIGSYDLDGQLVTERLPAAEDAVEASYAKGRVLRGDGAMLRVPIITANPYTDLSMDIHDRFRAFSVRDRMTKDGERAVNNPIWTRPGRGITELLSPESLPIAAMVGLLDRWLDAIEVERAGSADPHTDAEWQELLAHAKPKGLTDDCVTSDGERHAADDLYDTENRCTEEYPVHGDPRTAAGAPRRNDVIKCTLRPVDPDSSDGVDFTDEQVERLSKVFPDGVCDYSKPGVGQVGLEGTWLRYGS